MKTLLLTLLLIAFTFEVGICQQRIVKKHFSVKKNEAVDLHLKFGDSIKVKSWPKNEVAFKAVIEINQGKLNDALEFHFKHQNGKLRITSDYNKEKIKTGRPCNCPDKEYSTYSYSVSNNQTKRINYAICSHITYQIFVPSQADLSIKSIDSDVNLANLKGPIHVKVISGNITMVNLAGPIQAKSISGFVDLNWPIDQPARFAIKTISGQTYTNLDELKIAYKNHHSIMGQDIKGAIDSNGPSVYLKSISGNIYLRKAGSKGN
jgi:hypothetical protein